jgi:hypothetical protein
MNQRHNPPRNISSKGRKLESISSSFPGHVKNDPSFLEGQPIVATGLSNCSFFASGQRNALLQPQEDATGVHHRDFIKEDCKTTFQKKDEEASLEKTARQSLKRRLRYD